MNRQHLTASIVLILAAAVLTALCWPALPDVIPIHWDGAGQPNGFGPRWVVWLTGPGLMTAALLLGLALPYLSPRGFDVASSGRTTGYIITLVVAMSGMIHVVLLAGILRDGFNVSQAAPAAVCIVIALVGNAMGKVKRNFYIGIRTPWTLASERVWYGTHRLAGKVMVGTGVAGLLLVLGGVPGPAVIGLIVVGALLPVAYSLVLYKRLERAGEL